MELMEVVAPHVAVPVLGVLLCAFLVFAFGFKTPGQPPSFNFDDDSKKKRTKKQKPQKGQTNGHVPTGSDSEDNISKPQASPKQSAKLDKQQSPKPKITSKKEAKSEVPKKVKKAKDANGDAEKSAPVLDDDEGGWTTQVSRKDKKQKKKDAEPEEMEVQAVTLETKAIKEEEDKMVTEEAPQEQRTKKKAKKKSQVNMLTVTQATETIETLPKNTEIVLTLFKWTRRPRDLH
ncbi:hypothetical protein FSP39_018016 [Pinctada imbricata]|uniref:Uncharacterized protein n=1 Tax=Pinctada imbricata TaxID=66713 RepID=A0AA88Y842_PINIB|nr:hypothetical protein FSP39_018016 [Pinctada imbricata]